MSILKISAKVEELDKVLEFVEAQLDMNGYPIKTKLQIAIAVEEIFVNIAHYAYMPGEGEVEIQLHFSQNPDFVSICFMDSGIPYDPLMKKDPDITLSAKDRNIGGLGIYMVKKSMDQVIYVNEDGRNKLTIIKNMK